MRITPIVTSSALGLCPAPDPSIDPERNAYSFLWWDLVLPVPYLFEEMSHVDLLGFHLDHPWVLKHAPGCGSTRTFFLKAVPCQYNGLEGDESVLTSTQ